MSGFPEDCNKNILSDYTKECYYNSDTCEERDRTCDRGIQYITETQCHNLKASDDEKQKCVYFNGFCFAMYINCEDIPSPSYDVCSRINPLVLKGTYYDIDYFHSCDYICIQ